MHPDGYIQLKDRAKDIVISGGENISTVEVEQAIMAHPAVLDVAVVGVPHEKWGERPKAYVILKKGAAATAEEIIEHTGAGSRVSRCPRRSCSRSICRAPRPARCSSSSCVHWGDSCPVRPGRRECLFVPVEPVTVSYASPHR